MDVITPYVKHASRVLRLEVFVQNVYITNQLQTTFAQGRGGVATQNLTVTSLYCYSCIHFILLQFKTRLVRIVYQSKNNLTGGKIH
jgi:hypothetical protein